MGNKMSRYDGLEVLENSKKHGGYTQLTNYSNLFMYRVAKAGIVSLERMTLAMDMLTFKHGEECPFTTQDTFAKRFGCSVKVIKEGVSDLKNSGFINIRKKGRNNLYDLSPLLKCLASFVEHFHNGIDICIKKLVKDVLSGVYVPQMVKEEEKPVEPVFDEVITGALDKLTDDEKQIAIPLIQEHGNKMSSDSVEFYIEASAGKEHFKAYFGKCMKTGSDEGVKERKAQIEAAKNKGGHGKGKGQTPKKVDPPSEWLKKHKKEQDEALSNEESFNKKYNNMTRLYFNTITKKEAFKNQEEFIAWYTEEAKKHENEEVFVEWCGKIERERVMKQCGMRTA